MTEYGFGVDAGAAPSSCLGRKLLASQGLACVWGFGVGLGFKEFGKAVTQLAPRGGMTKTQPPLSSLPHHSLIAYGVGLEFAECVGKMRVADARLREQARKSTIACVLNIAEGAGRRSRADKSRVYAIALGELCEAAAAVELAQVFKSASPQEVAQALHLAVRLKDLLSRLIR